MLPFHKNPNSAPLLTVDFTPQLPSGVTLSSGAAAAVASGTDGVLTISGVTINGGTVTPANGRPTVAATKGVSFRPAAGTPGYVFTDSDDVEHDGYPVDIAVTDSAGNTLAERVYVIVEY